MMGSKIIHNDGFINIYGFRMVKSIHRGLKVID
jgi:hypothetical protein